MSLIIDKLKLAWIKDDIIDALDRKFSEKLIDEIQKNGLKFAAERAGLDSSKIPDLDFSAIMAFGDDILGKRDSDGDGKTWFAEIKDTVSDLAETLESSRIGKSAMSTAWGLFSKMKWYIKF